VLWGLVLAGFTYLVARQVRPSDGLGIGAMGVLGFVAVFLALSNRDGRFVESDRHFVQALVINSALCLVLGLTPRALSQFLDANLWPVALIVAMVGGALVSAIMGWTQIRMPAEEKAKVHMFWHVPSWSLAFVGTALILFGFFESVHAAACYVAAATVLLCISVWCFIAVVFRRFF